MNIEEIEQYLKGTLAEEALANFERRMAADTELAYRVDLMLQLDNSFYVRNIPISMQK